MPIKGIILCVHYFLSLSLSLKQVVGFASLCAPCPGNLPHHKPPTRGQLTLEENLWNQKLEWIFPSLSFSGILPWWCKPAQFSQYLTLWCDRRVQVSDLSTLKEHIIYYNTKILPQWELYVNTLISLHRCVALNIKLFHWKYFYRFNIVQKPMEIKSSRV